MIKLLLLLLLSSFAFGSDPVGTLLADMPAEDQQSLELLFSGLLRRGDFGYGFVGKPVCLSAYFTIPPDQNRMEGDLGAGLFWKQWKVWEKYRKQLPMQRFLLLKEPGSVKNTELIILINKISFVNAIIKNQELFDSILKRRVDPYELLRELEVGEQTLKTSINNNDLLWAVLLDYGIHNGLFYCHRGKLLKLNCLKGLSERPFSLQRIESLSFMVDPSHKETEKLKNKYALLRERLSVIYAKGDFLNITLSQLAAP